MRQANEGIDYTSRDYNTIKQSLLTKLSQIMPEYTDRSETDAGIVIIELLASALDALHYYNDRVANEMFLPSLVLEEDALKWCEILGYSPHSATSSEIMQTFVAPYTIESREVTVNEKYVNEQGNIDFRKVTKTEQVEVYSDTDTIIPKGTAVKTEETTDKTGVYFETTEELIIPKGTKSAQVRIVEGTTQNEILGVSNGEKAQRFYLKYNSVIKDSIKVYVTNIENNEGTSELWKRVDDFFNSSSTDKHFKVISLGNTSIIVFGDGSNGCIPNKDAQISAEYRVGGGIKGNVEPYTINTIASPCKAIETFNAGLPVVLGKDAESLEEIKINAPRHNRTKWGALTLQDFADVVLTHFNEVKFAKALRSETNIDDVDIYVLSEGENPNRVDTVNKRVNFFVKTSEEPKEINYINGEGKEVVIPLRGTVADSEPHYYLANSELGIYALKNIPYSANYSMVNVVGYNYRSSINLAPVFTDNYSMFNCVNNSWTNYYIYDPSEFNQGTLGNSIAKLFRENPDNSDDSEFGYKVVGTGNVNIKCVKPIRINVVYNIIVGYSYDPTQVNKLVTQAVESYFALGNYPIGETIYAMDLVKYVMQNVEGVSSFFPHIMSLAVDANGTLIIKSNKYAVDVKGDLLLIDSYKDDLTVNQEVLAELDTSTAEEINEEGIIPLNSNEIPVLISISSKIM